MAWGTTATLFVSIELGSVEPDDDIFTLALVAPAIGALGALVLVRAIQGRGRIRLDPEGIHYGPFLDASRFLRWKEIDTVELDPVWQLAMTMTTHRSSGQPPLVIPLHGQAWPRHLVVEVVQWYVDHRDDRAGLTDAAVLDRWRPCGEERSCGE